MDDVVAVVVCGLCLMVLGYLIDDACFEFRRLSSHPPGSEPVSRSCLRASARAATSLRRPVRRAGGFTYVTRAAVRCRLIGGVHRPILMKISNDELCVIDVING